MEHQLDRRQRNGRRLQDEVCMSYIEQGLCGPIAAEHDEELVKTTVSLKDVLIIMGVLVSGGISITTVYNNLNGEIKDVKHELALFKQQSEERTSDSSNDIVEIKKALTDINTKLSKLDLTLGLITKRKVENMAYQVTSN